jgi:hypothetical protein
MLTLQPRRPLWRSFVELTVLVLLFSLVLYDEAIRPGAAMLEAAGWVLAFASMDAGAQRIRDPRTTHPIVAGAVLGILVYSVWFGFSFTAKGHWRIDSWIPFMLVGQFAVLAGAYYGYTVSLARRERPQP